MQGLPLWDFMSGHVYNYKLETAGGAMRIYFPGLLDSVELHLVDVEIKGDVQPGADLAGAGKVSIKNLQSFKSAVAELDEDEPLVLLVRQGAANRFIVIER